ncbi:MAG: branched-chain amino acid ABC transporter permease [Aestuariivirga sp.]|uniref:branched-chain amino acid ABC transporter permease n=1 Tax=Aestuariivirga sp. TaxID=2650926 RepID=UPI0025C2E3EE|nr:branched-chain amino acid ABC transporter permease [Aestuariivirga sp.]MCA3561547.1 branched-chain amino acid ABC transporter permease [Aestuariivirga sp.]
MTARIVALHGAVIVALFLAQFVASDYAVLTITRIMVLAVYALGYNILFGYAGLLSLGHAMFFATGLYGAALGVTRLGMAAPEAFLFATFCGVIVSIVIGFVALRASGVAFMIVTLMFSQAAFLAVLYFGDITRGDEGIVIKDGQRMFPLFGVPMNLADPVLRYNIALAFLAVAIVLCLIAVRSKIGHVLVAIRENESRTAMLGYDVKRYKLIAFVLSGSFAAVSGAAYALLFAYAGSTLASIQYSIHPLLWTLLGGAATVLGPVLGTALMFLLVDFASGFTSASLLFVGVALILLVLFFPKGILGTLRQRYWRWLP